MTRFTRKAQAKVLHFKRKTKIDDREYETHYFYDADENQTLSTRCSLSKTERGARDAAIAKLDQERYNRAVVVQRFTGSYLVEFRRDVDTGAINVVDSKYMELIGVHPFIPGIKFTVKTKLKAVA